jgi:predicted cupin superfamily sugar epimerase
MVCAVAPGFDFDDFQMLSELSEAEHPTAALVEYR